MGAAQLLSMLRSHGAVVTLTPEGRIRVDAPEGLLDDALRGAIQRERDGIVPLLRHSHAEQERRCRFASFASFASADLPQRPSSRTMRTQRTQIRSPILDARGKRVGLGPLAPVAPGLPEEWREGLERLAMMQPLPGFSDERWSVGVWWARRLAHEHGEMALVLGWTAEDLFGLHPAAPSARYDGMGLAFLLRTADQILALHDECATILHSRGARTRVWRRELDRTQSAAAWKRSSTPSPE